MTTTNDLKAERDALRDALTATLRFMSTEMGWEFWRAEFLYFQDAEKQRQSEKNAETLRRWLRDMAETQPAVTACVMEAERRHRND